MWQCINDPNQSFAIVSAFLKDRTEDENEARHNQLRRRIQDLGYTGIELAMGYADGEDENRMFSEEKSFMIPGIEKERAVKLAQHVDQRSLLFRSGSSIVQLGVDRDGGMRKVLVRFKPQGENQTFERAMIKDAFSTLHGRDDFAFVAEKAVRDFPTAYMQRGAPTTQDNWIVVIGEHR
jgi:hypothetical protein